MLYEIENKASRGIVPQIILTILSVESRYGYEICKEIERMTNGELVLKQPSLYSSLRRLEAQELISSSWKESDIGAKRHYYFLSEKGKKFFEENKDDWQLNELISKLPTNETKDCSVQHNDKKNYSVASQETLFNLNTRKEEIKKIIENEEKDENQFFFQFDLFNQDVKSIKKPTVEVKKVKAYTNKYQIYDNNQADIEPLKSESEGENINNKEHEEKKMSHKNGFLKNEELPIVRNIEPRDSFEEDNNSNFDINELVEENIAPALSNGEDNLEKGVKTEIENEVKLENTYEKLQVFENKIQESDKKNEREYSMKRDIFFESNDYRSVIGKLFSNSQKSDPYEQNKFNTFKEIFPQTKIVRAQEKKETISEIDDYVASSSKSDVDCDDIEMLGSLFNLQGIKIKTHKNIENKKNNKTYTDKNKLNMASSWIVSLLMLIEITFTYIFLKNNGSLVKGQLLFFFLGVALALSIALVATLENLFDRYKLVILKIDFKKGITLRLLSFIIISVVTFAICLSFGMQGLAQVEFLAFWLLPILLSSNIIVSYLIYCFLLSHKYYNN